MISDAAPLARHLEAPLVGRERERRRLAQDYEDAIADGTCRSSRCSGLRGSASRASSPTSSNEWATRPTSSAAGACHTARESPTGRSSRCSYRWESSPRPWSHPPPRRPGVAVPSVARGAGSRATTGRRRRRPAMGGARVRRPRRARRRPLARAPIFLLCIARTELLEARSDWGGGKPNATSLLLEPLGADECGLLMEFLVPDGPLDPEPGRADHRRVSGLSALRRRDARHGSRTGRWRGLGASHDPGAPPGPHRLARPRRARRAGARRRRG